MVDVNAEMQESKDNTNVQQNQNQQQQQQPAMVSLPQGPPPYMNYPYNMPIVAHPQHAYNMPQRVPLFSPAPNNNNIKFKDLDKQNPFE